MLRRLLVTLALLLPAAAMAALPPAPAPTAQTIVNSVILDSFAKSPTKPAKGQDLLGYDAKFHTDSLQYAFPVCADAGLVEFDGRTIDPTSFVVGDTLTVTLRPDSTTSFGGCVARVEREQIGRGASSGECLQNFQVKHAIEDTPNPLLINTSYRYQLTIYARPTFDCDGIAYGSAPITTRVAASQPFIVTLTKDTTQELMRWTITTDGSGKASFSYAYDTPSDNYTFQIAPGTNATAGDTINWTEKVIDPNVQPTPKPLTTAGTTRLSPWPVIIVLILIAVVAGTAEYLHRAHYFKRLHETPEEEYKRAKKIRWRD
jgi:hypothetical protein